MLRLDAVDAARGRRAVLSGVDLGIASGERVLVTGRNGSGKSTLLRVLAQVARPRRGRLTFSGTGVAFLPERPALAEHLRAGDLLCRLRELRGLEPVDWAPVCDAAGLDGAVLGSPVGRLSKGQLQRVALLDALTAEPDLLVLDEPWEALDHDGRSWLAGHLQHATARGGAVVFTDHSDAGRARLRLDAIVAVAGGRAGRTAVANGAERGAGGPGGPGGSGGPGGPSSVSVRIRARGPGPGGGADAVDEVVEHVVARAEVDATLRALLDAGASIDEVGPA